jgi:hypothetical protein
MIVNARMTNGVSFGIRYTITAQDVIDGVVLFDFQEDIYDLVGTIAITDASDAVVTMAGVGVSYPDTGQIQIDDAGTPVFVENGTIHLIVQRSVTAESVEDITT